MPRYIQRSRCESYERGCGVIYHLDLFPRTDGHNGWPIPDVEHEQPVRMEMTADGLKSGLDVVIGQLITQGGKHHQRHVKSLTEDCSSDIARDEPGAFHRGSEEFGSLRVGASQHSRGEVD